MIQSLITRQLNHGYIYKHLRSKVMHYLKKMHRSGSVDPVFSLLLLSIPKFCQRKKE